MQKKSGRKSSGGRTTGSTGKGTVGSTGKAGSTRKSSGASKASASKASKGAKAGKTAKSAKAGKPVRAAKGSVPAKAGKAAKPGPAVKAVAKAKSKTANAAPVKPASKTPAKPAAKTSAIPATKAPAKTSGKPPADGMPHILSLPEEMIAAVAPRAVAPAVESMPDEDEGALRNVMASLTSIFGGKDFMSDAELDALLDSKMASGEIPPSAALDPLDEAQSLIYEAWNSEGLQRVRLARRALETCPDCADAYVILAEEDARDRKQSLELYRQGVQAAERALDPALFRQAAGKFWGIMETRPYMRARLGLAECLWEAGSKEEALGHLRDLLRLNPSDNQGVRYILAQVLLETGAEGELGELLERFRDDASPQIRYSHALWMFRREGPGRKADALLEEAVRSNPHVPDYLLKRKKPPKSAPRTAEAGSEEEAGAYAMGAVESWQNTLGAVEWLARTAR